MEKYSSGRRGAPAKGIGRVTGARVQIPPSPLLIWRYELFKFFLKKLLTRNWTCDKINKLSALRQQRALKKVQKKNKKVVDNDLKIWYLIKAVWNNRDKLVCLMNIDNWTVNNLERFNSQQSWLTWIEIQINLLILESLVLLRNSS